MYADHPGHAVYDSVEGHWALVRRLLDEFPDGWAMSCSSPSLLEIAEPFREFLRVAAWVKPFASYKPNVTPAYTWEPVLFAGGRKATRSEPTGRDSFVGNITMRRGFPGAKSDEFAFWLFEDLFNARPEDEFVDLFPGSGAVTRAWETWCGMRGRMHHEPAPPDGSTPSEEGTLSPAAAPRTEGGGE